MTSSTRPRSCKGRTRPLSSRSTPSIRKIPTLWTDLARLFRKLERARADRHATRRRAPPGAATRGPSLRAAISSARSPASGRPKRGREREGRARGGPGIHPRHPDGARLSRHRPSRSRARSAEAFAADAACAARTLVLRLPSRGPRPFRLRRRRAGDGERHAAPDGGDPQAHLLRPHRLRVHAHQRCRAEGLAAAPHRRPGQGDRVHARRQARDPEQADRGRRLREIQRRALPRHQALRARRRRIHDPGAGADHQARRPARREGDRARHEPSRGG